MEMYLHIVYPPESNNILQDESEIEYGHTKDLTGSESDLSISEEDTSFIESLSEKTDDKEAFEFNSDDDGWYENHENIAQIRIYQDSSHTYISSYVSIMLFVMKHSLTKDTFSDLLKLIQTHLPKNSKFTSSVYRLKDFLRKNMDFEEPIKHYYCNTYGGSLGEGTVCPKEECRRLSPKS